MKDAGFGPKTVALIRKDLTIEARGRDTLLPMIVFAATVALLAGFALPEGGAVRDAGRAGTAQADVVAGFLWITILFAGLLGFARTFEVEREEGAIDSLLLVPLDRSGLFVAKAAANLVALIAVEAILFPLFGVLFGLELGVGWLVLVLVVVLADIGFVSIGTLFAALAAETRSRELLLPILALPALVPVFLAAAELSSDLFVGSDLPEVAARGWFAILVAFDVVAAVAGALTFEFALD